MTSKLVVNTIEADTGISSVSFASSISMDSTSKFHFSAAGVDIGADTNINRPAAGALGFNINSSEKVRILSGGVGIGITNPDRQFEVNANSANTFIRIKSSDTGNAGIEFGDQSDTVQGAIFQNSSDNSVRFNGYNNAERFRIDSSGRLLVGQTSVINGIFGSPPPRFSVSTSTASPAIFATFSNDTYGSRIDILKSRNATVGSHTVVQANDALGEIYFGGSDGDQFHGGALIQAVVESGVGNDDMPTNLRFYTNGGATTVTERLRITSTGYIGINTSSPQYPLHVAGHTTDSSPDGIGVLMGLQHNHALIHLNAESDMGCIIDFSTPNNDRKGGILYYHSNNSVVANRDAMQFHTAGAERLRITSGGHTLFSGLTDHNDSTRNVKGITIKSTGGVSFQNFGSNGSRNWRIRPDDMSRWGDLDFSVSPTANSATDWPDAATDKVLTLGYDGTVLKPRNPAFIAGRTGGNQTFTVGTFPLNVARLNVGNHYNTSTYKFVAPVAGVYYFYAQVYYNNGAGQYRMGFRKTPSGGSAFMLNTSSHKPGSNDTADHMSIIESLAVNDTVELYSDSNYSIQCYYNINDATYGAHTYLMGYLIG